MHRPCKTVLSSWYGIGLFQSFFPLYFLVLEACLLFPSVVILDSLPSDGRDGFDFTITPPFLNISYSCVEFTLYVFPHLYGIIKTEISIKSLPGSILNISYQENCQTVQIPCHCDISLQWYCMVLSYSVLRGNAFPSGNGLNFVRSCHKVSRYMGWCVSNTFNVLTLGR